MTERDPVSRLESLGAAPVGPPSEELVGRLSGDRLPARTPEPRRIVRLPVLLPAAAVAALLLGFVLITFDGGGGAGPTVVLENAVDASVETGGSAIPARAGATVGDGAVITVGPAGSVRVGEVTLGPGERGVVRAGRLERLRQRRQVVAAEWRAAPVSIDLEARRSANGAVVLRWSAFTGDGAAGYVIFRDDRSVVARRRLTGVRTASDRASPEETHYVVVVVDAQAQPLARSQLTAV